MKTLEEMGCSMYFKWNNVFNAWNGCLTKTRDVVLIFQNGVPNHIKCFVYTTKEECTEAATIWANNNSRSLRNYKGD